MSGSFWTVLSRSEVWLVGLGLAAFLTLFWVLRGAPPGQAVAAEEDEDAPLGGYRDRVVTAVTVGLLLIVAGGYLALTRGILWSVPAFALGFGTVLTLISVNQRYRHGSPTLRRTLDLSAAGLNVALFAGTLVVVNVIAYRYGGRALDMTREGSYSLSTQTVNILRSLPRPVTFTTFYGRSPLAGQQHDRLRQLLEMYKGVNPGMIRLDQVDPYRDLDRYESLTQRAPDVRVTQGGGVLIEYGEGKAADRAVVRNADLFEIPRAARFDPTAEQFETSFKGEAAVTTALMRLRDEKKPKVVFTTGHGEPSVEVLDENRPGLGVWKSRLTATGAEVVTVNPLTEGLPDDASLVVVVGPKTPFKPEEVARLKAYSDRKKPLLFLVGETGTGLEGFLKSMNVEVGPGFVVEPRDNARSPDQIVVRVPNGRGAENPIVESLEGLMMLFYRASPLKVVGAPQGAAGAANVLAVPLLHSTPQSWAETGNVVRRDEKDEPGPLDVAVAVSDRPAPGETRPGAPRMVVLSSRNLADNRFVLAFPPNLDLLMNSASWLRGTTEYMGISPKRHVSLTLTADPEVRVKLVLVPTVIAVGLIVTLGIVTYLARRD
jgi:hypothetical protein